MLLHEITDIEEGKIKLALNAAVIAGTALAANYAGDVLKHNDDVNKQVKAAMADSQKHRLEQQDLLKQIWQLKMQKSGIINPAHLAKISAAIEDLEKKREAAEQATRDDVERARELKTTIKPLVK